jgi:elongation of very long chain fatty acids protein 4
MNRTASLKEMDAPSRMATPPPCQVEEEVKTDSLLSVYLLPPLLLVGCMVAFYSHMQEQFQESLKVDPYVDPFKQVSWSAPIAFSVAYLSFLYFGKMYMRTREQPFEMKHFIVTYNAYQCILNLWCVLGVIHEVYTKPIFVGAWGNTPEPSAAGFRISFLVWVHYNNKYVELLDSVFMVLKKKDKQLSFLHCYHHVMLIWAWFLVCRVEATGDSFFGATVNSFIHVIMYSYYTLALLGVPTPWKKWITTCQMIQFAVCLSHSVYVYYMDTMPVVLSYAQAFVMVNMLYLFGQFYKKSYAASAGKKKA